MKCNNCKFMWTPSIGVSSSLCPSCGECLLDTNAIDNNTEPHEILLKIVQIFDKDVLGEDRLKGILSDTLTNVEIKYQKVFKLAVVEKIGLRLLELENEETSVKDIKIHILRDSFKKHNGLNSTADYIIDCFLYALGWIKIVNKGQFDEKEIEPINILNEQINIAFIDRVLTKEEAKALFTKGQQLGFSDVKIAILINKNIKSLNLKPHPDTPKSLKSQKDIICSSNWLKPFKVDSPLSEPKIIFNPSNILENTADLICRLKQVVLKRKWVLIILLIALTLTYGLTTIVDSGHINPPQRAIFYNELAGNYHGSFTNEVNNKNKIVYLIIQQDPFDSTQYYLDIKYDIKQTKINSLLTFNRDSMLVESEVLGPGKVEFNSAKGKIIIVSDTNNNLKWKFEK